MLQNLRTALPSWAALAVCLEQQRGETPLTVFRYKLRASLEAQLVKDPPARREAWVPSLGWEDPLEKGKPTHSSVLAWRIPWTV